MIAADKLTDLDAAVAAHVRPGQRLHAAFTHNRPAAALRAVLRRFAGVRPDFEFSCLFTAGPAIALLTEGLVRRLVTALVLDPYPAPGPSQAAQRAQAEGRFDIQHWSVLGFIARLQAAALGFPAWPVLGLRGTTMAAENEADIIDLPDLPLQARAWAPDVCLLHAAAADRQGNVLIAPPYGEGIWGAMAARQGVVATVERIVAPEVIRRHAHLLVVPASRVLSVSEAPLGAHPAGQSGGGIEDVEAYADDPQAYVEARAAGADPEGWRAYVASRWTQPRDPWEYLTRLGADRQFYLKGKAQPDSWRAQWLEARERLPLDAPASDAEHLVVAAARLIAEKASAGGYEALLAGLGLGSLAAWCAHELAAERGRDLPLVAEIGMAGYRPRPCDPYVFNFRNLATCAHRTDAQTAIGLWTGGAHGRGLGALGAAQVDARGNFNSTRLADGRLITGSGGSADVAAAAAEVVLCLGAQPGRLVRALPYVTGVGERVTAVVTDRGVFEKPRGAHPLRLTRLVGPEPADPEAAVRELRARVGFEFSVAEPLETVTAPTVVELERLRLFDPERALLGPLPAE